MSTKRFTVSVPIMVEVHYTIEAEDADDAIDKRPNPSGVYEASDGSIGTNYGYRLSYVGGDVWDWQKASAVEVKR